MFEKEKKETKQSFLLGIEPTIRELVRAFATTVHPWHYPVSGAVDLVRGRICFESPTGWFTCDRWNAYTLLRTTSKIGESNDGAAAPRS